MTLPPLTDQKLQADPVEGLRVLVADLRALAGRLELKERGTSLQTTLEAAQERVCGPRAVVMLLGEDAELKRRFLERLLGPNLTHLPNPTTVCTRLEYGPEPESAVIVPHGLTAAETPRQAMQSIRLPNPTLKGGLAVIDTPVIESAEPAASVLECAEQADAWIFVLNADHALSEASQALLRRLPERGARLEMVVENADALSGEERLAARERLMQTLRKHCNIEAPRLTLVASAATEGDEGSFWHGRYATFHSVMMLRGRERWLEGTRTIVQDALSKVDAEIDFELKRIALGVRHARLRLGLKDLDGLRTRFSELVGTDSQRPLETKPVDPQRAETTPHRSLLDGLWSGGTAPETKAGAAAGLSPLTMLAEAIAAMAPEGADTDVTRPEAGADPAAPDLAALDLAALGSTAPDLAALEAAEASRAETKESEASPGEARSAAGEALAAAAPAATPGATPSATQGSSIAEPPAQPAPRTEPDFAHPGRPAARVRPKHGLSVHLSGDVRRLLPHGNAAESGTVTLLKRAAWVALLIAILCLILWALAPRGFLFGQEAAAIWDYRQPKPVAAHAAPAATSGTDADLPQPGDSNALPNTSGTATPDIPGTPLAKPSGAVRMPLPHPIPSAATADVPHRRKRHHRHLLGLGKLWHWIRHPHHSKSDQNN